MIHDPRKNLDCYQNVIDSYPGHAPPLHKISSKPVCNFFGYFAHRHRIGRTHNHLGVGNYSSSEQWWQYFVIYISSIYCKTRIFRMHQIFANFASRIKSRNYIPAKIQFAHQSQVNTSRTVGKRQIKMQRNFYNPKSRN